MGHITWLAIYGLGGYIWARWLYMGQGEIMGHEWTFLEEQARDSNLIENPIINFGLGSKINELDP